MSSGRVLAAFGRRLGRRPGLATAIVRLPRALPRRPRAALYRSFSWPLAKRLGTVAEVNVAGGGKLRVRTDDSIGRALAVSGVWEPNVTAAFARLLRAGDVCIDAGAHIGYYTVLASSLVGPRGHVYAFEPSPANYGTLMENLELNRATNVTARNVALALEEGSRVLNEGPGTNTGRATLRVPQAERDVGRPQVTVPVRALPTEVPEEEWARIRVVKIDVEGFELEVLRSLEPVFELGSPLAVFLELTPGWVDREDLASFERMWREHGLTPYVLRSGYTVNDLFPARIEPPIELTGVPPEQCDLLLTR
ncbi:MAG: FkbM family methyltransferase [Gaiellaceae bacterium]